MSSSLSCRVLKTPDEIHALLPAWKKLYETCGTGFVVHPALFASFATTLAAPLGWSPFLVAAFEGDTLRGVLPLATLKRIGIRILRGAANGVYFAARALAADQACTDFLWQTALESGLADLAWIECVPQDARDAASLNPRLPVLERFPTFVSDLTCGASEAWLAQRGHKCRGNLRRWERNLEKAGAIGFDVYRETNVPDEALNAFLAHKRAWCVEKNVASYLPLAETDGFLRRLADDFFASGQLLFTVLKSEGNPIAWNFCMTKGETVYCLMMAHDPAFNGVSPGSLVWKKTVFWALENGFTAYDMMHHTSRQKEDFSSRSGEVATYRAALSLKGRILLGLLRLKAALRR